MTSPPGGPREPRALDAFAELTRDAVAPRTDDELEQGLDALFDRIGTGQTARGPGRRLGRWWPVAVSACVCSLVALKVVSDSRKHSHPPDRPALVYQIDGGSVSEGGYLRESGHAGIKLSFNEGSNVMLMPGTRGRLRSVDPSGARVAIEHGTASFQVTQGGDRRWLVEVGPFLVTVKGTVFSVSWDSSSERFELGLRRGRVVVSGPVSGGDIVLRAGQRLIVNLADAETLIMEEKPEEAAAEPAESPATVPAVEPRATKARAAGVSPAAAAATSAQAAVPRSGKTRWADELASGHWDRILEDVERTGMKAALEEASSEDLFALANAARYRRRMELARAALLAERRRFPSSPRALDALFLLGRVDESGDGARARAIAWYDEYLAQAPRGAYVAEALGRKMTLANEIGGPERARPVAEEYLRLFPKGSYAGAARALRRIP
jgi:TolA-binding protein